MRKNIIIVIALLAALGLFFGLISPKYQSLQALRAKIKEKSMELQTKQEYFSQIKETSENLKTYEDALTKMASALPVGSSLASLASFLQQTASQSGLALEQLKLDSDATGDAQTRIKETSFSLEVSGAYPDFKNFLASLEQSARIIELDTISFATPAKAKEPFNFNLTVKAFSY